MKPSIIGQKPWKKIILIVSFLILIVAILCYYPSIREYTVVFYNIATDKDHTKLFLDEMGYLAPLGFIGIQIVQVIFAPIPGEASGFIGGFLFGAWSGFIYSSIGLTIGSCINFFIGRLLGTAYIRKIIPILMLKRFDAIVSFKGSIIVLLLFIFPGFPKDYFCLFLGISAISPRLFFLFACLGRMPGTLLLSFQGALLFENQYYILAICAIIGGGIVVIALYYKKQFFNHIDKEIKS